MGLTRGHWSGMELGHRDRRGLQLPSPRNDGVAVLRLAHLLLLQKRKLRLEWQGDQLALSHSGIRQCESAMVGVVV